MSLVYKKILKNHTIDWQITSEMRRLKGNYQAYIVAVLLAFIVAAVYWRILGYEFLFDDAQYIQTNVHLHKGLNAEAVKWCFTAFYAANWHPVTWISHMLDCQLFGLDAGRHHVQNLLFHTINTILLFVLLLRLTGSVWKSGFVAALFGVHPLHVESVAWVSERKDVLSAFFGMLTILAYVRYTLSPGIKTYVPILMFFTIGLMAKPMIVTLPFVLLLLDYWPLNRWNFANFPSIIMPKGRIKSLVLEKIPLFCLSAVSCFITYLAQEAGGTTRVMKSLPLGVRLANALVSYVSYILKAIWPQRLAVFYPHPEDSLPTWEVIISAFVLFCLTVIILRAMREYPYLGVGWLWYLGTLVPVIGLVQVGSQAMADRYTYIPLIGIFILVTWGISDVVGCSKAKIGRCEHGKEKTPLRFLLRSSVLPFIGIVALIAFIIASWVQVGYWRNPITLFGHTVAITKDNFIAHFNLALALAEKERHADAIPHYEVALKLRPTDADAHQALADSLVKDGRADEAVAHYYECLKLRPNDAKVHCILADVLADLGRTDEAIANYREAIRIEPDFAEAYTNLGVLLVSRSRVEEGIAHYLKAMQIDPHLPNLHYNLGIAFAKLGKFDDAIRELELAIKEKPDDIEARRRLVGVLFVKRRYAAVWQQVHELQKLGINLPEDFLRMLSAKMPEP